MNAIAWVCEENSGAVAVSRRNSAQVQETWI